MLLKKKGQMVVPVQVKVDSFSIPVLHAALRYRTIAVPMLLPGALSNLKVIILVGKSLACCLFHVLLVLREESLVDLDLWRSESWRGDELLQYGLALRRTYRG